MQKDNKNVIVPGSIAGNMIYTTVRILTTGERGMGAGTGFIFNLQSEDQKGTAAGRPFLITNRHVVENTSLGMIMFFKSFDNELSAAVMDKPTALYLTDFPDFWFNHPDDTIDLCATFLGGQIIKSEMELGHRLFFRAVTEDLIPEEEYIDAIEDVYMIGYPNAIMDDQNLIPVVRKGVTATPWVANYKGKRNFLVDISVFPGSSGSPIFLMDQTRDDYDNTKRVYFLGVMSAGYSIANSNSLSEQYISTSKEPTHDIKEMLDLGIAIKSSCVIEMLRAYEKKMMKK